MGVIFKDLPDEVDVLDAITTNPYCSKCGGLKGPTRPNSQLCRTCDREQRDIRRDLDYRRPR